MTVPVKHVIPDRCTLTTLYKAKTSQQVMVLVQQITLSYLMVVQLNTTTTWVSGQAPNKDNTRIGEDITVTAHILIDGETTPITKTATYKVVRTVPKHVFEQQKMLLPSVTDIYNAKQYVSQ